MGFSHVLLKFFGCRCFVLALSTLQQSHSWTFDQSLEVPELKLFMRLQEMFKHQLKLAPFADQIWVSLNRSLKQSISLVRKKFATKTKADYISNVWLVDAKCCSEARPLVAFARGMLDSSIKFVGVIGRTPQP